MEEQSPAAIGVPQPALPLTHSSKDKIIHIPSILITAHAVTNKARPFIQVNHCFPDSSPLIINSSHRCLIHMNPRTVLPPSSSWAPSEPSKGTGTSMCLRAALMPAPTCTWGKAALHHSSSSIASLGMGASERKGKEMKSPKKNNQTNKNPKIWAVSTGLHCHSASEPFQADVQGEINLFSSDNTAAFHRERGSQRVAIPSVAVMVLFVFFFSFFSHQNYCQNPTPTHGTPLKATSAHLTFQAPIRTRCPSSCPQIKPEDVRNKEAETKIRPPRSYLND